MKLLRVIALFGLTLAAFSHAAETTTLDLNQLLENVEQGRLSDQQANDARLASFRDQVAQRETLLKEIVGRRTVLENTSASKEADFEANELTIAELEDRLRDRMGSLQELFGVLQQTAGDAQAQMYGSLTQLEYPERTDFLVEFAGRMGQATQLPTIPEIERLWFELQREMTASGQIVRNTQTIVRSTGGETQTEVTRIGLFNSVADGQFLKFIPETGRLVEYNRQPPARYLAGISAVSLQEPGLLPVAIDPVRGQLLDILTQAPNLLERIEQGGLIGYAIITLGILGVGFACLRLVMLFIYGQRINRQLKSIDQPQTDNALGRILGAAKAEHDNDPDALELRVSEAILAETPRINAYIPLLKIIAAVAPLMGLLGTVTGMIITFQAITLFGAGDPRLMAGGISQALVTTVLGLCVAIPMLLLHNLVQMRAKSLTEILQKQTIALVATQVERSNDTSLASAQEAAA